jgi:hypothetical protein
MTNLLTRSNKSSKTNQKHLAMGTSTRKLFLAKNLLGAIAVVAGILGSALQANAAIKSKNLNLSRPEDGDLLDLVIYYDDTMQFTIDSLGTYSAGLPVTATNLPGPFIDTTKSPVSIPGYDPNGFTGYAITGITGRYYEHDDNEWYNIQTLCPNTGIPPIPTGHISSSTSFPGCGAPTFGSPADATNGLFSKGSYTEGISPPTIIGHTLSDKGTSKIAKWT